MTVGQGTIGAILAGGAASRFGSDKALASFEGIPLIDHVAAALRVQTVALVVVGREHGSLERVEDHPQPGLGPLGAISGALRWAQAHGYAAVLSAPCDAPLLPPDLTTRLAGPGPAYVAGLPVLGWWPAALADHLASWLAADQPRAVRRWAAAVGAREVRLETLPPNVNTREDLAALTR
ncbi:molybdenum cofactor guanylyltransferase [Sphingomonas mucosissima]|uniref:Molybdenum cofactor guanylyltransferase n=1 Tax=Sphingomonas mucosissima TaxID=370959 RepID=A0A245ZLN3_9SPHN|nr:molybdenum cofactor guanylyltransferase [Sphingomonas mucosissima]OWK30635.1 molybdenum cofactor guanylyltransferase [Sphingomonas mucosissima]